MRVRGEIPTRSKTCSLELAVEMDNHISEPPLRAILIMGWVGTALDGVQGQNKRAPAYHCTIFTGLSKRDRAPYGQGK